MVNRLRSLVKQSAAMQTRSNAVTTISAGCYPIRVPKSGSSKREDSQGRHPNYDPGHPVGRNTFLEEEYAD